MSPVHPPRLAVRMIAGVIAEPERSLLLSDLHEGFDARVRRAGAGAARRWYWKQTVILVAGLAGRGVRDAVALGALRIDVARAFRSLRRSPGLTAAGILTLGIGVAAPTGTFAVVDAMFARLPVDESEDVTAVQLVDRSDGRRIGVPLDVVERWSSASSFSALGAYDTDRAATSGEGLTPRRVDVASVTSGVFDALGVRPVLGRAIVPSDGRVDAAPVVLVSEALWADWFDRDPDALGRTIRVGERSFDLVGVMPSGFGFPESQEVWTALRPAERGVEDPATRERLARAAVVVDEYVLAYHGRTLRTLMSGLNLLIGFLVLIAAANLSAFFLARGTTRSAETAVRLAVGGGRLAVVRPLVLEALVVCGAGTAVGVVVATYTTPWMGSTLEARGSLPYWADFGLSPRTLAFAAVLMLGATAVTGVWPALRASRADLPSALRSGRGSGGPAGARTLSTLVGVEVLLSCVLLVFTGIVVRAALGTVQTVGAFPVDDVITAELVLEDFAYPGAEDRRVFFAELERLLGERLGVTHVAIASALPGDGTSDAEVAPLDAVPDPGARWPSVQRRVVSPAFFEMFAMETLQGTTFGDVGPEAPRVAVVNEAYVREELGGSSPVGQTVLIRERGAEPVPHEIVGLVRDPGVAVDDGQRVSASPFARAAFPRSAVPRFRGPCTPSTTGCHSTAS